jgi:cytochrome P450
MTGVGIQSDHLVEQGHFKGSTSGSSPWCRLMSDSGLAAEDIYWDPFDTAIDSDPHSIWRIMREARPVYRNERYDFWALSRFDDILAASKDHSRLLSGHGTTLELMTTEPKHSGMILTMDPPEHDQLRRLVSREFTVGRIRSLESHIRGICVDLLNPLVETGGFDYVKEFGAIVPSLVIASFLGVPQSDREWLRERIDTLFHLEPGTGMSNPISMRAGAELKTYLSDLLNERRAHPVDDLLSHLVQAEITQERQSRRLDHSEAVLFAYLLVTAGTETTGRLLSWAALLLDEHQDQRAELVNDPSLIPGAIEELLRFEPPSPVQARFVAQDVEFQGTSIPAGSRLELITGSAGRDERRFSNPDHFDIHRQGTHLSFGFGTHFCLGAALARLEARVALEETLKRLPTWGVDRARAVQAHTSTVRGYSSVPIAF